MIDCRAASADQFDSISKAIVVVEVKINFIKECDYSKLVRLVNLAKVPRINFLTKTVSDIRLRIYVYPLIDLRSEVAEVTYMHLSAVVARNNATYLESLATLFKSKGHKY